MRRVVNPRDTPILGVGGCWTNPKGLGSNGSYLVSWQTAYQVAVERDHGRLRSNGGAGSYRFVRQISTDKRACVDRTDRLPDGQLGSSPENGVLGSTHERSS
jgi:hypothetical protein